MRITSISKEAAKSRDDGIYIEVLSCLFGRKKHKLRVKIRSNPYDFQSYSRIERWSGSEWKLVHALTERKTRTGLGNKRDLSASDFKEDRTELIRVAERVLS